MTFGSFLVDLENYLRVRSTRGKQLLLQFTNEAILKFARMYEWQKLLVSDEITTDGSGFYELDNTILTYNHGMHFNLIISGGAVDYDRYDYEYYLRLSEDDRDYTYSIFGTKIYLAGTGETFTYMYTTPGSFSNYPLVGHTKANAQEPKPLAHYPDIVKRIVAVRMLKYLEDDEQALKEQQEMLYDIEQLKKSENREEKNGKPKMIIRPSGR